MMSASFNLVGRRQRSVYSLVTAGVAIVARGAAFAAFVGMTIGLHWRLRHQRSATHQENSMNMAGSGDVGTNDDLMRASMGIDAVRVALATAMILLGPLVAMQFTHGVQWTGLDFGVAAVLLASAGWICLRTGRRVARLAVWQRVAIVGALALVFAALWIELAVGVLFNIGS